MYVSRMWLVPCDYIDSELSPTRSRYISLLSRWNSFVHWRIESCISGCLWIRDHARIDKIKTHFHHYFSASFTVFRWYDYSNHRQNVRDFLFLILIIILSATAFCTSFSIFKEKILRQSVCLSWTVSKWFAMDCWTEESTFCVIWLWLSITDPLSFSTSSYFTVICFIFSPFRFFVPVEIENYVLGAFLILSVPRRSSVVAKLLRCPRAYLMSLNATQSAQE